MIRRRRCRVLPPSPTLPARAALAAALVLAGLVAAGCATDPAAGWSGTSTFPSDVRTIAIPIATNDTYVRDVEFDLTDALIKEIEARTPYKVTSEIRADTVLLAQVRQVDLNQLSRSPLTGLGEEVVYGVTIDFEWRDLRTDAPRLVRKGFAAHGLFTPSAPDSERIGMGRLAAVQELARAVVSEMRGEW